MFILVFLKSIFFIGALLCALIGLGVGLYKAVEFIGDRTFAAKKRIEQIMIAISIFHVLLILRGVNFFLVLYSLSIQYVFYTLLKPYPNIQPSNPVFIAGSVMALGNHFLMLRSMILGNHYMIEMVIGFLVAVWMTPFCFYLSLSANDMALPFKGRKTSTWIGRLIKNAIGK
jgi:hypothetical protein